MSRRTMNDGDREEWVNNDEGLYSWWRSSGKGITVFVRQNRAELTALINGRLGRPGSR